MKRRRSRQTGFTLFELLAAMTVGSVILMASTMLIGHAFDWTTQSKHRRQDDQTMFRLSRQFRSDVHDAADIVVADEKMTLVFADDSTANYTSTDSAIQRQRLQPDADTATHQDSYEWHRPRETIFKIDPTNEQVVMTIKTPSRFASPTSSDKTDAPSLWRSVSATAGLRLKHEWGEIQP